MEMYDLGKKLPKPSGPGVALENAPDPKRPKVTYPSFSIEGDQIPDFLKSLGMGKMVRCEVTVCKSSHMENSEYGDPARMGFNVYKIGLIGDGGKKTKDEYMKLSKDDRDEYDQSQLSSDGGPEAEGDPSDKYEEGEEEE